MEEFTTTANSGWMYTVNGTHPNVGVSNYTLYNGDVFVVHYTDDYTAEQGSEHWISDSSGKNNDSKETKLSPKVTAKDGVAAVTVGVSDMSTAIADAKKNGSSAIVIEPAVSGKTAKATVELPKSSLSSIASDTNAVLTIVTPTGNLTIPNDVLSSIVLQTSGSSVTVSLEAVEPKDLTAEQQKTVGNSEVYEISILSGVKAVGSFDGRSITISLPYALKDGETTDGATVWYLNDAGKLERMNGKYDADTKLATFATTHLSKYVVGYEMPWANPFADVKSSDWFYDAVRYVSQSSLMSGTSSTTFAPKSNMTRAMIVTVLYRLEGKPTFTGTNSFTDVESGQWYTDAVVWASTNKLVTGYGSGLFGTTDSVTREQLAAILCNYAKYKGYDVTKTVDLISYTDFSSVDSWATMP